MMAKTTLSDGRRTRPRFAAPTPTPPKFLIGTDDPARIGILPVLRREGSDQRESKGFGWDPAKTLRMAEPPKFLIGTIEQSENHSTPAKQTTYPNPNGHKTALSGISRPLSGLVPLVYPERRRASPASRRAQPHPRKPLTPLPAVLLYRWPPAGVFEVLATSRPLFALIPLAQPHPRKPSGLRQSIDSTPFAQPYPRKLSGLSRSLDFTPFAQLHLRNLDSPQRTRLPRPPQRIALSESRDRDRHSV